MFEFAGCAIRLLAVAHGSDSCGATLTLGRQRSFKPAGTGIYLRRQFWHNLSSFLILPVLPNPPKTTHCSIP
jgi:hypothetical protein